jgi:hypothetical protein
MLGADTNDDLWPINEVSRSKRLSWKIFNHERLSQSIPAQAYACLPSHETACDMVRLDDRWPKNISSRVPPAGRLNSFTTSHRRFDFVSGNRVAG